jgi:hypothetical protein
MEDACGNSGWFAVGHGRRGKRLQIRTCTVLDLIWPRGGLNAKALLLGLAKQHAPTADLLVLQGRIAAACAAGRSPLWRNPHGYYRTFVLGDAGAGRPLAEVIDLVPADGD